MIAGCLVAAGVASSGWSAEPAELDPFAPSTTDCSRFPLEPDGTRRELAANFQPVSGIAAMPPRIVTELDPGERATYCIGFQNRGAEPIDLELDVVDVAADEDGVPSSQRDAEDQGASRWVKIPSTRIERLESGATAWLLASVNVPKDALPGSAYASILASVVPPKDPREGAQVQTTQSISSQLFFDIEGDAERSGTITEIESPKLIWWDGFDLGDLPVLERLRGLGIAPIRFTWKNTGDYTNTVEGRVVIKSDLSDRTVAKLPIDPRVVLRDAEREFDVTWQRDIPLLGRFTPVLEVTRDDGAVETHELDPIWVIPSWWYFVALAVAIGIPLWWRHRSRQRYYELLMRLEAAESRVDGEDADEDWDDELR